MLQNNIVTIIMKIVNMTSTVMTIKGVESRGQVVKGFWGLRFLDFAQATSSSVRDMCYDQT